jgi:hypothetical protein
LAPAVIVAIVSVGLGSMLTYAGLRLNRRKELHETRRYARALFRELFELTGKIDQGLADFRARMTTIAPSAKSTASSTRELLLELDALRGSSKDSPEFQKLVSAASTFHYATQAQRTLLVHSVAELVEHDFELLNAFERYSAYHAILISKEEGFPILEKWLPLARDFYDHSKKRGDCTTMVRMGITLTGIETEEGLFEDAVRRVQEMALDAIVESSGFSASFLRRRLEFLRGRIEQQRLLSELGDESAFPSSELQS